MALLRERVERWNARLAEFAPPPPDYAALPQFPRARPNHHQLVDFVQNPLVNET